MATQIRDFWLVKEDVGEDEGEDVGEDEGEDKGEEDGEDEGEDEGEESSRGEGNKLSTLHIKREEEGNSGVDKSYYTQKSCCIGVLVHMEQSNSQYTQMGSYRTVWGTFFPGRGQLVREFFYNDQANVSM